MYYFSFQLQKSRLIKDVINFVTNQGLISSCCRAALLKRAKLLFGKAIRLKDTTIRIINKAYIFANRIWKLEENVMTIHILAKISKTNYPIYKYKRCNIFCNKEMLSAYCSLLHFESHLLEFYESKRFNLITSYTESIKVLWQDLLVSGSWGDITSSFSQRFTAGNVLMRIICLSIHILTIYSWELHASDQRI